MGDVVSISTSWSGTEQPKETETTNTELFESHIRQCKTDLGGAFLQDMTEFAAFCRIIEVDQPDDIRITNALRNGRFTFMYSGAMYFGTKIAAMNGLQDIPEVEDFFDSTPSPEEIISASPESAALFLEGRKLAKDRYRDAFSDMPQGKDLNLLDIRRIAVNDTSSMLHRLHQTLMTENTLHRPPIFNISQTFDPKTYDVVENAAKVAGSFVDQQTSKDPEKDPQAYTLSGFLKGLSKLQDTYMARGFTDIPNIGGAEGGEIFSLSH